MLDQSPRASKEFLEFQRGVFKALVLTDGLKNALMDKGLISADEIFKAQDDLMQTDYVKDRMAEYDKAIKEVEEYEKMDLGDLFASMFTGKAKEKSNDHSADS